MITLDMFGNLPAILYIVLLFVIIGIIFTIIKALIPKSSKSISSYKYQKRNFLTKNEFNFYKTLCQIANKKGLVVFSKVRLLDLIEPLKGARNWQECKNKISQKHVDFVLCDGVKINPVLIIELDDSTHDQADRQQRDKFVDQAFESVGIPILHTRTIEKLEENIISKLSPKVSRVTNS